jgi:hypothetical protein
VSGCGMAVHSETIRMVRGTEVPSSSGVVVMGTVGSPHYTLGRWGYFSMVPPF